MNSRKIALFLKRKQHVVANAIALQLRYRWRRTLPSSDTATNRKRRNPPVADYHIAYDAVNLEAVTVGCLNQQRRLAQQNQVVVTPLDDLTKCVLLSSQYVASRQNTHNTAWGDVASLLEKTVSTGYLSLRHGGNCVKPRFVPPHHRVNASVTANSLSQAQAAVGVIRHSGSLNGVGCAASTFQGVAHQMCWGLSYGKSVPAPCEWYPIVLPNNPDSTSKRCRKHQVGNRVPIRLNKRHIEDSGRNVPLDLTCRRKARGRVPLLETYMILNKITAKCGEIALNPLSASARADMGGYCWMCELTLSPDDFFKLGLV